MTLDREGTKLHVGDYVVLDNDLYEIEAIEDHSDNQPSLLHLLEVGRLPGMIREHRTSVLSHYVYRFEKENEGSKLRPDE